jgi:hypothetical protein
LTNLLSDAERICSIAESDPICFSSTAVEELSCFDEKFASRLFNLVEAFALDGLGPAQAFLNL